MAEEVKNTKSDVVEKKPPKKSIIRWVLFGGVVVIVGLGGYFGWSLYAASAQKESSQKSQLSESARKKLEEGPRIICPLESFIVNLMDKPGLGKRYLKATIELEVSGEAEKNKVAAYKTQLRDAILMLLSGRSVEEINTVEGKLYLKQALLARINQTLPGDTVRRIYFTEFVIQ